MNQDFSIVQLATRSNTRLQHVLARTTLHSISPTDAVAPEATAASA